MKFAASILKQDQNTHSDTPLKGTLILIMQHKTCIISSNDGHYNALTNRRWI